MAYPLVIYESFAQRRGTVEKKDKNSFQHPPTVITVDRHCEVLHRPRKAPNSHRRSSWALLRRTRRRRILRYGRWKSWSSDLRQREEMEPPWYLWSYVRWTEMLVRQPLICRYSLTVFDAAPKDQVSRAAKMLAEEFVGPAISRIIPSFEADCSREPLPISSLESIVCLFCQRSHQHNNVSNFIPRSLRTGWSSTAVKSSLPRAKSERSTLTLNRSSPSILPCIYVTINFTPRLSVNYLNPIRSLVSSSWMGTVLYLGHWAVIREM